MPQKFKILAADKIAAEGLNWVKAQADAELIDRPGIKEDELATIVADADAMVVRSGVKVTRAVLANPGNLKIIARAGVGVDNIDLEAATEKGILVVNTAAASTITTAEHAFTLMASLLRNVGQSYSTMKAGGWDRNKYEGRQMHGLTLGVIGFGRIGQTVAERALAFGMNVVAFDPVYNGETAFEGKVKLFKNFAAILPLCDVLTFHVPAIPSTLGMLGEKTFPLCKKGVYVVNCARGGIIDEAYLPTAIEKGECAGAALDVFVKEPLAADSPLRNNPKILLTPHLGASTQEAQTAVSVEAMYACMKYLRGEGIDGAVNAGGIRVDLSQKQQAYVTLASRASILLAPMITRGIAEVTVTVRGTSIAKAAGTIERATLVALFKDLLNEPVNLINVVNVAKSRNIVVRTIVDEGNGEAGSKLTIEVKGPPEAVDAKTPAGDQVRRIAGCVYEDLQPRIVEINGYHMDMVPTGAMVLLQNADKPGMIGAIGATFGAAKVNIAEMAISRRAEATGTTALMVLKVDSKADDALLAKLTGTDGVLKVAQVALPQA